MEEWQQPEEDVQSILCSFEERLEEQSGRFNIDPRRRQKMTSILANPFDKSAANTPSAVCKGLFDLEFLFSCRAAIRSKWVRTEVAEWCSSAANTRAVGESVTSATGGC